MTKLTTRWTLPSYLRDRFNRGSGSSATSQSVVLPVLLVLSLLNAIQQLEAFAARMGAAIAIILLAGFMAWLFFTVVGAVLNAITLPLSGRILGLILLFAATEVIRTTSSSYFFFMNFGTPMQSAAYLITAGAVNGLVFFGLSSILQGDVRSYRSDYRTLAQQQFVLAAHNDSAENQLATLQASMIQRVRDTIESAVRIAFVRVGPGPDLTAELLRVSDHVVRPLSQELLTTPEPVSLSAAGVTAPQIQFRRLAQFVSQEGAFRYGTLPVIAFLIGFPGVIMAEQSLRITPAFLATVAVYFVGTKLLSIVHPHVNRLLHRSLAARYTFVVLGYMAIGAVGGLTFNLLKPDFTYGPLMPLSTSLIAATLFGMVLATTEGIRAAQRDSVAILKRTNDELEWRTTRMRSSLWIEQSRLARLLHSDVQATLVAQALRYRVALNGGDADISNVAKLEFEVTQAVNSVFTQQRVTSIDSVIEALANRWTGVIEVTCLVSGESRKALARDEVALSVLEDILAESVTNAVKHGSATKWHAELNMVSLDRIALTASNNGAQVVDSQTHSPGLGSRLLDIVALEWTLSSDAATGLTTLRATIPIGRAASSISKEFVLARDAHPSITHD